MEYKTISNNKKMKRIAERLKKIEQEEERKFNAAVAKKQHVRIINKKMTAKREIMIELIKAEAREKKEEIKKNEIVSLLWKEVEEWRGISVKIMNKVKIHYQLRIIVENWDRVKSLLEIEKKVGFFNTKLEISTGSERKKVAVLYINKGQNKELIIDVGLIKPMKITLEQEIELIWGKRITVKGKVSIIRTLARKYEIVLAKSIFPVIGANITERAILLKYCKELFLWRKLILYGLAKSESEKKAKAKVKTTVEKKEISTEELITKLKELVQENREHTETILILPKDEKMKKIYRRALKEGTSKIRRKVFFVNEFQLLRIIVKIVRTNKRVKKAVIVLTKALESADIVLLALQTTAQELTVIYIR